MTCNDCGDAISMNNICKTPLQSATDMLKHMAVHNASRAFAVVESVKEPEPEAAIASTELAPVLAAPQPEEVALAFQSPA
jgi:proteasome lid subunit RPN8/RPN11